MGERCNLTVTNIIVKTTSSTPFILYLGKNQLTRKGRLVVGEDKPLQLKIIRMFHEGSLGGHSGMQAIIKKINYSALLEGHRETGETGDLRM